MKAVEAARAAHQAVAAVAATVVAVKAVEAAMEAVEAATVKAAVEAATVKAAVEAEGMGIRGAADPASPRRPFLRRLYRSDTWGKQEALLSTAIRLFANARPRLSARHASLRIPEW